MTKEDTIKGQLQQLGVYDPAFDAEIKDLCMLERERHRTRREWKATAAPGCAPDASHPLYKTILQQDRIIHLHRNDLGLTPKGLERLRNKIALASTDAAPAAGTANQNFAALMDRIQEASHAKE